ncbi:MAG: hypothetical protein G01um101456_20 [Parcubacteria group bacterium Gr01-1014_56]|nr:MAG: hypothetical protein G01um101456_20 [Parcubacteria group bacterium Gr01-1014_56]
MVPVNYLAVLVSAIVMMGLGFLWYGPLFGKEWMRLSGFTPESMNAKAAGKVYAISAIGALLMAFVMSHSLVFAMTYLGESGIMAGLQTGFWNWLGFVAPVTVGVVLWEGKSWKLWAINSGYYLVALCMIGVILALWK